MKKIKKTKQTEKEIEIVLRYAESIIATLREPFLVINKNLRIVSANHSFCITFKVAKKETIGQLLPNLGNGQWNIPKLIHLLKEILPQKIVITDYEIEHEFETIGHRIMNLNACQLRIPKKIAILITEEEEEEEELILLAIEDITKRKKAEKKVAQLAAAAEMARRELEQQKKIDRAKTEFISLAAHQLRTPLTAIRWYFEDLKSEEIGKLNPKQKDYSAKGLESTIRMIRLVNDLLNVSRLETGHLVINPQPTDLIKLVENIITENTTLVKTKNCQLIFIKPKGGLPLIKVDPILINQVINNLISNSVRYLKKQKGKVEVILEKNPPNILLSIKDNGIGIPQKVQKRIFSKLFRADNAVKMATDGTGLGLYIAKMIIDACGGKIWFSSKENKGTTFCFTLPLAGSKSHNGDTTLATEI